MLLPGLALAALAGYSAGAGCYAISMNCFSVVVPNDSLMRALFSVAAFLPFGAPAYVPVAATGLRGGGARAVERWLWVAPLIYAGTFHAACILFANAVFPSGAYTRTCASTHSSWPPATPTSHSVGSGSR